MDPLDLPPTLLDLLATPVVTDSLYQYLSRSSLFQLARVSRQYRDVVFGTPKLFRYLDLSNCKGAYLPIISRIDNGGHSWRAERMDENLTEDEFYGGPLRSVLNRCHRMTILQDVQILILDGLGSVTHDLLNDILSADERYNVRLLSIRQCPNVNQSRLQQLLNHICRPSRPAGTPRLQGLYFFTNPANDYAATSVVGATAGVTSTDGATLGLLPSDKGECPVDNAHRWYSAAGRVISIGASTRTAWEETLQACEGIIAFDAVLCKAMHEHASSSLHDASRDFLQNSKPGISPLATIALGPDGCAGCGKAPEGTPTWDESDLSQFPLLAPPPRSGKLIDALRPPMSLMNTPRRLIVSCKWCLVNRHCDSCHRWWCTDCYNPKQTNRLRDLEALSNAGLDYVPTPNDLGGGSTSNGSGTKGDSIKVFNGLCVENCLVGEMMAGAGSNGMWA